MARNLGSSKLELPVLLRSPFGGATLVGLRRMRLRERMASADCVWRALPVGTGHYLRNSRVASQPLRFDSVVLRTALDISNEKWACLTVL